MKYEQTTFDRLRAGARQAKHWMDYEDDMDELGKQYSRLYLFGGVVSILVGLAIVGILGLVVYLSLKGAR